MFDILSVEHNFKYLFIYQNVNIFYFDFKGTNVEQRDDPSFAVRSSTLFLQSPPSPESKLLSLNQAVVMILMSDINQNPKMHLFSDRLALSVKSFQG